MTKIQKTIQRVAVFIGLPSLLILGLTAGANENDDYNYASAFGNHNMRGDFAYSMDGSFSSAPPPFTGESENFAFSQTGLYTFDGHGGVTGEFSLVFENETSGGVYSTTIEIGTYSISEDGRMIIQFEDFRGDLLINEVTLDCVIVKRRRLARCAMVELISFLQGPEPVVLPVTGLGSFERRR